VLALVEAPDVALVTAFARLKPAAIELGNELELPPFELGPSQYGDWIARAALALQAADYRGIIVSAASTRSRTRRKSRSGWGLDSCSGRGRRLSRRRASLRRERRGSGVAARAALADLGDGSRLPTRCHRARARAGGLPRGADRALLDGRPARARVSLSAGQRAGCSDLDTFGIDGKPAAALLRKFWAH
jgi:hypothetical protein